jgi:PKHD-type hydroxylase
MLSMWQMWKAHLSPETCQDIIDVALLKEPAPARLGSDGRIDLDYRDSEVRFLHPLEDVGAYEKPWSSLHAQLGYYIAWANHNAFGIDIAFLQHLQFTTYREERQGHFKWHRDVFWQHPNEAMQRKLTAIVQLSDPGDYEGGDFELDSIVERPKCEDLKARGTLLVFPSFIHHRVMPVTKGVRHSLVAWMAGPNWR